MSSTVTDVQQSDYSKYEQSQRLPVNLTPEEMQAWQQCMKSSSILSPALITAAIGYGFCRISPFRANAKYFALVGGVIGLITGRIAASEICLAKVASMPNSTLRDRLAEAGYGNKTFHRERQPLVYNREHPEVQSPAEPSAEIVFDDYPPMNSYDTYSSINQDHTDLSEDTDLTEPINLQKSQQKGVSYDELRHRNRNEFYEKTKQWYAPATRESPVAKEERVEQVPIPRNRSPIQEKTKYGDVWG